LGGEEGLGFFLLSLERERLERDLRLFFLEWERDREEGEELELWRFFFLSSRFLLDLRDFRLSLSCWDCFFLGVGLLEDELLELLDESEKLSELPFRGIFEEIILGNLKIAISKFELVNCSENTRL
jgi:hypothetical protein